MASHDNFAVLVLQCKGKCTDITHDILRSVISLKDSSIVDDDTCNIVYINYQNQIFHLEITKTIDMSSQGLL